MTQELLRAYAAVAGPVLVEHFERRSCVASTRALVDAMQYFGISVKPVAVAVSVVNATWRKLHRDHGEPSLDEIAKWVRAGARAYRLDGSAQNGVSDFRWHVVGLAHGSIVDSSAAQFSDPDSDCVLPDVVVLKYPPPFEDGDAVATFPHGKTVPEPPGTAIVDTVIQYEAAPHVRFRHLPAWKHTRLKQAVAAIITAMRRSLTP